MFCSLLAIEEKDTWVENVILFNTYRLRLFKAQYKGDKRALLILSEDSFC